MSHSDDVRGQPIPDTVEAWKHHAYLMADLAEEHRQTIGRLRAKVNDLEQKLGRKVR